MEVLLLSPSGKDYLWGGTRLKKEYGKDLPLVPLAETWECSVHPDGPSVITGGSYAGRTLKEVLDENPEWLGSKVGDELPILVKFIDAEKDLSVQVHPDDEYARIHENQNGKTEMWYVLDAAPGAELIHGFAHDVTPEQLREAVRTGKLSKHLQKVKVRRGDTFFIPPGTIHAIGAGIMVAEIQEEMCATPSVGYGIAPIGHDTTVVSVSSTTVNISTSVTFATGYSWSDSSAEIQAAIEAYLLGLRETWSSGDITTFITVYVSRIESAILSVEGVLDVSGTKLNGSASNLVLSWDAIPILGTVTNT